MGQRVKSSPRITVNNEELVARSFTYLVSTISDDKSLNKKLDRSIGKACATFSRLCERVWDNKKITVETKISVYTAFVISTLLYGNQSWAIYDTHEKRLNSLHMKFLKQLLGNKLDARVTSYEVAHHAGIGSLYSILRL